MKTKVITAIFIVAILLGIFLIPGVVGNWVFAGVFSVLALIACFEINRASKVEKIDIFNLVCSYLSVLALLAISIINIVINQVLLLLLFVPFILYAVTMVFNKKTNHALSGVMLTNSLYVGIGFACIILLRNEGLFFIIYAFIVSMVTDAAAQIGGMLFGRHKLIPSISPKKTVEGAIIGTIMGCSGASLFGIFLGAMTRGDNYFSQILNPNHYDNMLSFLNIGSTLSIVLIIVISLISSIIGQIGDLLASKIKRSYEIKDFSNILPGHGGILDRFDSIILISIFLILFIGLGGLL
jgi:phosphatidate cytidylyltransferase